MTSLHWKIIDPLNFTRILAVVGMIYIALQGWQVLTMKLQGIKGGVQNTILSLLPLIPILGTIFINFPQNGDNWWELILYTLPVVIDLGIFMPMSMRTFQLASTFGRIR